MNVIYQHLTNRKDEEIDFDWDFLSWEHDRKRTGRRKNVNSKQKSALVPKTNMWEKEEGAIVAASHLPSLSGLFRAFCGPDGQKTETSPNHWERLIKYLKCPTFDAKRRWFSVSTDWQKCSVSNKMKEFRTKLHQNRWTNTWKSSSKSWS